MNQVKNITKIDELPGGFLAWYMGSLDTAMKQFEDRYRRKPTEVLVYGSFIYIPVSPEEARRRVFARRSA